MKKIFLLLLTLCLIPLEYSHAAAYGSPTLESEYPYESLASVYIRSNTEERKMIEIIYEVRSLYQSTVDFHNLEKIEIKRIFSIPPESLTENDLKKIKLNTENNEKVAIIKYQTKNCNDLKNIKEKLRKSRLIGYEESVDCKANEFTARLIKT